MVTYLDYTAGSAKGSVEYGHSFNNPFALGANDGTYTGQAVVENYTATASQTAFTASWTPGVDSARVASATTSRQASITAAAGKTQTATVVGTVTAVTKVTVDGTEVAVDSFSQSGTTLTVVLAEALLGTETTVTADYAADLGTYTATVSGNTITISGTTLAAGDQVKIAYTYNNMVVPQDKLPMLNVEVRSIALLARARRIAVLYSQMAAFQAKTDYGFDMGAELAKQAAGQLAYEVDTEVVQMLKDLATDGVTARINDVETTVKSSNAPVTFNRAVPIGVSMAQHFESFNYVLEQARAEVYSATRKFAPNWIVVAADVLPVITFLKGFTPAPAAQVAGPYYAGQVGALKVFVSPALSGEFIVGCLGNDMMTAPAVYAPYMPIVPTQLLQMADGGTTQGWSTLYDIKPLNANLVVYGTVTSDTAQYSYNTAYSVSGS